MACTHYSEYIMRENKCLADSIKSEVANCQYRPTFYVNNIAEIQYVL